MPRAPKLRTYDEAREELGGKPWLPKPDRTDRWFLVEARVAPPPIPMAAIVDTDVFDLKKRMTLSTKLIIVVVVLFVAIAVVAINL